MEQGRLNWITNFIWGIADDVLRDLYVRGKYRDVILPMVVLRRLDTLLEPTQKAVLDMKASLDTSGVVHLDSALRQAAGQAFYNTSPFTLRDLRNRASQQQLRADFEAYLDGFSPNVQEILENFEFCNQIPRLSEADALGTLIEKFLSPDVNLSPKPVLNGDSSVNQPGLDNHAMGTLFEELVRRFNEENNEEAGEHRAPRDAVKLMARLILLPIADEIEPGTHLLYDAAATAAEAIGEKLSTLRSSSGKRRRHEPEVASPLIAELPADYLLSGLQLGEDGSGDSAAVQALREIEERRGPAHDQRTTRGMLDGRIFRNQTANQHGDVPAPERDFGVLDQLDLSAMSLEHLLLAEGWAITFLDDVLYANALKGRNAPIEAERFSVDLTRAARESTGAFSLDKYQPREYKHPPGEVVI